LNGGLNTYGYVNGNPINLSDPTGLCPWCLFGALAGGTINITQQLVSNGWNWNTINIQSVGIAAGQGLLGGGLGTAISKIGFSAVGAAGWSAMGSSAIGAGGTALNNAVNIDPCVSNNVKTAAINGFIGGAFGSLAGTVVSSQVSNGLRGIYQSTPLAQRLLKGSNAIHGVPQVNFRAAGTTAGNAAGLAASSLF